MIGARGGVARTDRAIGRCRSLFQECDEGDQYADPDDAECPAGDHVTGVVHAEADAGEPDAGNDGYRAAVQRAIRAPADRTRRNAHAEMSADVVTPMACPDGNE